jgi:hypothetical protein
MSILHLIVRRHLTTRAPDRRAQRGCTVPPLLHEAAAVIVIDTARAEVPQNQGAATPAVGGRRVRR